MYTNWAYGASINSATLVDQPFIVDGTFSTRNNHPITTVDFDLVAATAIGATIAANQIDSPSIDAWNPLQVYPVQVAAAAVQDNPNVMDLRRSPIKIPLDEEIQFKQANAAGGAERNFGLLWLRATAGGTTDYPVQPATRANPRFIAIGTHTTVVTQLLWSPFVNMAFTNPLRGGVYQLNALWTIVATGLAYRINFIRQPMYQGIKLFPGNLCEATFGNRILRYGGDWLGGLGRFSSLELPQISILGGTTAGSATYTFFADLSYLGELSSANQMPM